jgi:iron(III) transport system permease protein
MTSAESGKLILGGAGTMASQPVRQKASSDDILMRVVLAAVALWLVGTVLLPLGALLIKSVEGPKGEFVGLANFVQ